MLKATRVILAIISIMCVTLLFVDFTGTAQSLWPWMAKIQFIPALLSVNILAILSVVVFTLIFGRLYCSVICPLGIFQDVVNWIRGKVTKSKHGVMRFKYIKAHTRIRLSVLTAFLILIVIGLFGGLAASIAGLIEPYSAYGRIASQIFAPGYDWVNNQFASWAESRGSCLFYQVICAVSIPVFIIAIVTLVTIIAFAWRGGRDYCNTVCPVGTILGYISRYSLLKIQIDTTKCVRCGKCGRACKAKCLDTKHHKVDYSRCVACFDCIGKCKEGAIKYTLRRPQKAEKTDGDNAPESQGRRGFLAGTGFIAGALAMRSIAKTTDGGLTPLKDKQPARRSMRIVPPGAKGIKHMSQHCTACQLCIQACPNHILHPTIGIDGFMQPSIDYTEGYCTPSCTRCSEICPAGAIEHIDVAQKSAIKIGTAKVDLEACISAAEGKKCGNCARHCPAGAIKMIDKVEGDPESNKMPMVNEEICIGCGACEYYCPVGTVVSISQDSAAIHVEGIARHREI